MADIRIPTSPIHGCIAQVGDATHPGFVQLLNPTGSGKRIIIYELYLALTASAAGTRFRARRTAAPLTLAGTITTALVQRRDEADLTAIVGLLKGCTAIGTVPPFAEVADSFWFDTVPAINTGHLDIIRPNDFPLTLKAGSALEISSALNSASQGPLVYAVWDELAAA